MKTFAQNSTMSLPHTGKQQWLAPRRLRNASTGKMARHILKCHHGSKKMHICARES
jgi:hypothetical protein